MKNIKVLAGGPGFEPGLSGSEPLVLPLNYPPTACLARGPAGRSLTPIVLGKQQSESAGDRPSAQGRGQFGKVGDDHIGLVRGLAERALAAVDEGRRHAMGLGADAVEGVVGNEQASRAFDADDLLGLGVGLPVRLEMTRFLDRDDVVEFETDMGFRRLQHVAVAVGQDRQPIPCPAQPFKRGDHIGKRLQPLDLGDQAGRLIRRMVEATPVHDVRHRAPADLAVRV